MNDFWVGIDFDGTLAHDVPEYGDGSILGEPNTGVLAIVKRLMSVGVTCKIFTARVAASNGLGAEFIDSQRGYIESWCWENLGAVLEVVAEKNFKMVAFLDDRAISVSHDASDVIAGIGGSVPGFAIIAARGAL